MKLSREISYTYVLCGRRTLSHLPLTCVSPVYSTNSPIDVLIEIGHGRSAIPEDVGASFLQHTLERSYIRIEGVADFEISQGRQIRLWPAINATQKDIEIFLLGPVWATLCHQRQILPLHASAIATENGVVAFSGHSGAGKSYLAALMTSIGFRLFADDILPITLDQKAIPGAWPYLRRLKLNDESIHELALAAVEQVSETLDTQKYFVIPKCLAEDEWRRLHRLYVIEKDSTPSRPLIQQLSGADAAGALIEQTYHFDFIRTTRRFGEHLRFCTSLLSKTAVYRVRRPTSLDTREDLFSLIRDHLEKAVA